MFLCACVLYLENAHLSAQRTTYMNYTKFLDLHERQNFSNITEEISYESAGAFFKKSTFIFSQFISVLSSGMLKSNLVLESSYVFH